MKAIGSHVVLTKVEEEVKNKNGLIMTEASDLKIRYKLGEIVSVGDLIKDLSPGDKVYYDVAGASDIRVDGKKYSVVTERGIVVKT
jgi:co-chaperonin GroES (HSP10)